MPIQELFPNTNTAPPADPMSLVRVEPLAAELSRPGLSWLDRMKSLVISFTDSFKAEARDLYERAQLATISDQSSYDVAAALERDIKSKRAEASDVAKPITSAFFAAHRASTAAFNDVDVPLSEAQDSMNRKLRSYEREQERLRQEAEARARAERERIRREEELRIRAEIERIAREQRERDEAAQRERERVAAELARKEQDARLENAIQAEAEGASPAEVEHMLEQPVVILESAPLPEPEIPVYIPEVLPPLAPPPAMPSFERASGRRRASEKWRVQPDPVQEAQTRKTAKQILVEAAAADISLMAYLIVDESALNRLAGIQKQLFNVPGYRAYDANL